MKIGMQTWGSHGDIRPFLALAEGLQAGGHEVHLLITCADSDAYANLRAAPGLRISVIASPVITPEQAQRIGLSATARAIRCASWPRSSGCASPRSRTRCSGPPTTCAPRPIS